MAQAPTLYQFEIALNHVDRGITETINMRTARHPSETMQRLWLRVLAFAWHWEERIAFGPGLSDPEAPDLLVQDLVGMTRLWVRVGKAEPVKIQRTASQNKDARVAVFFESPQKLAAFKEEAIREKCTRLDTVEQIAADPALIQALAAVDERRTKISLTLVGEHVYAERDGVAVDGPLTR